MPDNCKLTMTPQAHSGSGNAPMLSPVSLYEVEGMPGDERVEIVNTRTGNRKQSWQIRHVVSQQKTGDYKTKEEALSALAATSQPNTLEQIKKAALALGYTKIQCKTGATPAVYSRYWVGFASHVEGGGRAKVDYYMEGNKSDGHKVRVHKVLQGEDHWYILS
jgi:hypothetical protein